MRGVWGECAREANDPAAHTGVRRQRVQARGSMGVEGRHRKGKGPDAMGGTEARTYTCTCNTCNACTCNTCNTWVAQRRGSAGPTLRVSIKEEGGSEEGGKTEHGQRKGARQMTGSLTGPQLQPPQARQPQVRVLARSARRVRKAWHGGAMRLSRGGSACCLFFKTGAQRRWGWAGLLGSHAWKLPCL